ncbi:MAG: DNRLRE domain-containing protein, partial [Anaerolineae bacterium]|nr:DNRLRE domain-containing protein [Anaerolineae bacterium]
MNHKRIRTLLILLSFMSLQIGLGRPLVPAQAAPMQQVTIANSSTNAYGFSAFMLQEESDEPAITITDTPLNAFTSEPGEPSAEQSYTVSGSNLTEDIVITAPTDFEISTTSGSGFGPSLTLSQSDGAVPATTIYVRFNRATEGTSSGDIVHTSTGATTQYVAVSGEAIEISLQTLPILEGDRWRYFKGTEEPETGWNDIGFDDSSWLIGPSGFGYGDGDDNTILSDMQGNYLSVYARKKFYVADPGEVTGLTFSMDYDDGFVAYLNGVEIASDNVTGNPPSFDTTADGNHEASGGDTNPSPIDTYSVDPGLLVAGTNVLAVQGHNRSLGSSDFSLIPTLEETGSALITVSFQEGVNGYTGTVDTFIMESDPETARGDENWVEWDNDDPYNSGNSNFGLIRFDNIFGSSSNQIPPGATIESATLAYVVNNSGDPGELNEVAVDWGEDVTYNSFGTDSGVQASDYGTLIGTANGDSGTQTIDVTASLVAWASDPAANRGWIFRPTDSNGVEFRSSEYEISSQRPRLEVTYSTGGPTNQAPDQPTLVQPADGATDISTSPTLEVTVTDPDDDALDVTFYGRKVGGTSPGEDFTLVVLPDTQNMATSYPEVFNSMTQWIADNKTAQNIVFVTHVGDLVNIASSSIEWSRADAAFDILDEANVPYSVGPGNHDLGSLYNTYFGPDRFIGNGHYQGSYATGQNENNYSFFSASGLDFIIINLQYNSTSEHLDWADALLKANPNRRGIVVQHNILNVDNSWQNQAPFNALKDNPNLFLMLCGHMHNSSDGAAYRAEQGDDGHTIHIMLADYQDYPNGGNGYMRLLRFSPADDTIYATTYSPYDGTSITTYPDQMEMAYDMAGGAAFEVIGMVNDVASGDNASIVWGDLANDTEYQWYAVANDGTASTTSATWSFTTLPAIPNYHLTMAVSPPEGGTTDPIVGSHAYPEGTVVNITAIPAAGYVFDHWEGDVADANAAST